MVPVLCPALCECEIEKSVFHIDVRSFGCSPGEPGGDQAERFKKSAFIRIDECSENSSLAVLRVEAASVRQEEYAWINAVLIYEQGFTPRSGE